MSWTQGIKADVEGRSFTTVGEWHAHLVREDAAANSYPRSGPRADERTPYIEAAGMVLNWLVYGGPERPDKPSVQAAMDHIKKCVGG